MFHLENEEEKGELHYEHFSNSYYGQRHGISDSGHRLFLLQGIDGASQA